MADDRNNAAGSPWLRRLALVALVIGTIVAGRRWAISRSDEEFERRLMEADRTRE